MKKFIVVGGTPFTIYNRTTTFVNLKKLGIFDTEEEAEKCTVENYEDCKGLITFFEIEL